MAPNGQSRNQSFNSREPFKDHRSLHFRSATGTFRFLNPTRARFQYVADRSGVLRPLMHTLQPSSGAEGSAEPQSSSTERTGDSNETEPLLGAQSRDSVSFLWRSRDDRKGRHALVRPSQDSREGKSSSLPARTNTVLATLQGIKAMATRFPYWDITWLVAVTYTLGSLVWVANGFFVVLSIMHPESALPFEVSHAVGWSAFVGATIFFAASILMMIEVLSASPNGCFGWEVKQTSTNGDTKTEARPSKCEHHHQGSSENEADDETEQNGSVDHEGSPPAKSSPFRGWIPSWRDLKNHYIYEIGFIASSIQMAAAILFWGSKFLAIPQINDLVSEAALLGGYYVPSIIGGLGFIVSSAILMLETQPRWYIPAPGVLGWHEGFWKLVGSIGFTVSAGLGPFRYADQVAYYQSSIASFWGSWAILIGSLVQWYESLDKHPVVEEGPNSMSESPAKGYE